MSSKINFASPTPMCDIALVVEGRKLYCNKGILAVCSPVFEAMFKSEFLEKNATEIELKDKAYDDMFEFLEVNFIFIFEK